MATATSQITIIDLSDSKQLSCYISSNLASTQFLNQNGATNIYSPDWTNGLVITPHAAINGEVLQITSSNLQINWTKQIMSGNFEPIGEGETVTNGTLVVSQNQMNAENRILTYRCELIYTDPDNGQVMSAAASISYSCIVEAVSTKSVEISGEQIFKYTYSEEGAESVSPSSITLAASVTNLTILYWEYLDSAQVYQKITNSDGQASITINPEDAYFFDEIAQIRIVTQDAKSVIFYDYHSVAKLYDGKQGEEGPPAADPYSVINQNQSQTVVANSNGEIFETEITVPVQVYKGVDPVLTTLSVEEDLTPYQISVTCTPSSGENPAKAVFSIANKSTLNNLDSLTIVISATADENTFSTYFTITKAIGGVEGLPGAPAIFLDIFPENGTVFYENEDIVSLTMTPTLYEGSVAISENVTYEWFVFDSQTKTWASVSAEKQLVIEREDVDVFASYKCVATYNGQDYEASITVEDKTDPYFCFLFSTSGTVLRTGTDDNIGNGTCLYAIVQEGGEEIDSLLSTDISESTPDVAAVGDFWYRVDYAEKTVTLMVCTRATTELLPALWEESDETQALTYIWYRGMNPRSVLDPSQYEFARGKVIAVTREDISSGTTFYCDVEK